MKLLKQVLGERASLRRELSHGRADVGANLPAGICEIADLLYLVQSLPVVIEQRIHEDVAGASRANSCGRGEPADTARKGSRRRYRHHRRRFKNRPVLTR